MASIASQVACLAFSGMQTGITFLEMSYSEDNYNQSYGSTGVFSARLLKVGTLTAQMALAGVFVSPFAGAAAASIVALALFSTLCYVSNCSRDNSFIKLSDSQFSDLVDTAAICTCIGIAIFTSPAIGIFSASIVGAGLAYRGYYQIEEQNCCTRGDLLLVERDVASNQFKKAQEKQKQLVEQCAQYDEGLQSSKQQALVKFDAGRRFNSVYSERHLKEDPLLQMLINVVVPENFKVEEMVRVSREFSLNGPVSRFYNRVYGEGIRCAEPSDYGPLQRELRELAYLICKENERVKMLEKELRKSKNDAKKEELKAFINYSRVNLQSTFMAMEDLFDDQACGGRDADIILEHKYSLLGVSEHAKTMRGRIHIALLKMRKDIVQQIARPRDMYILGFDSTHRANAIIKNMGQEFGITAEAAIADSYANSFGTSTKEKVRAEFNRLYNQETITRTLRAILEDSHDPTLTKDHVLDWFAEGLGEEAKAERWGKLYTEDYTDFNYEIVLPCLLEACGFSEAGREKTHWYSGFFGLG